MIGTEISELSITYKPVATLRAYEGNARTHSKVQIRQIAASIKEFGFTNPVLINSDDMIVAGHGRVLAAKQIGMPQVPTICLSDLTPNQIRAYIIADNRLAERAGWDEAILKIELQHLLALDADFDVTITGFEIPEIDLILEGDQRSNAPADEIEEPVGGTPVLFEGGAGEKIRRTLLQRCTVHTLLRLPTGIWYSPAVKANVIFFDKKPVMTVPATREIWVYDLRSSKKFSVRQSPIEREDLTDFVQCYRADDSTKRQETPRFRRFKYSEIIARDKANLDFQWQDEALNGVQDETPKALMKEILKDLEEAMREFSAAQSEIDR